MRIEIQDDFELCRIAESGQCFRWEQEDGVWRIPHRDRCLFIARLEEGCYALDCSEAEYAKLWAPYFDLDTDYRAIRSRISPEGDPFLFRASQVGAGIRILRQDPWETLISFVISQNRNIPAIRRSIALLCDAAGPAMEDRQGRPFHAFPGPEAILALDDMELDACRLGYRGRYVRAAARAVAEGLLDLERLTDSPEDDTMAALTALYGVGVKVASCVSLFGLHHLDAFPIDVWMRRALEAEYPKGYPREQYSPFNGVYQQYIFAYYRRRAQEGQK